MELKEFKEVVVERMVKLSSVQREAQKMNIPVVEYCRAYFDYMNDTDDDVEIHYWACTSGGDSVEAARNSLVEMWFYWTCEYPPKEALKKYL